MHLVFVFWYFVGEVQTCSENCNTNYKMYLNYRHFLKLFLKITWHKWYQFCIGKTANR